MDIQSEPLSYQYYSVRTCEMISLIISFNTAIAIVVCLKDTPLPRT